MRLLPLPLLRSPAMHHASRRSTRFIAVLIGASLLSVQTLPPKAEARPKYKTVFEDLYPKVGNNKKLTCSLCHPTKSKKELGGHYAQALGKKIAKNEKNKKKIKEAIEAIEDEKCPDGGKTWGERLKLGSVPCPHGSSKRPHEFAPSYIERLLARP